MDGLFGQVHIRQAEAGTTSDKLPLICLHQSPKSSREFRKILPFLAKDRQVIAIDSPGHGESDLPPSIDEATIENYATSAWEVVKSLGLEKIDILGHHTGAKVATEMAVQQPDRVQNIVMVSALVLNEQEINEFEKQFDPIPLDHAGTRFTEQWKRAIEYKDPDRSLEDLADSFAENLRAGNAYEWGHKAAFEYSRIFAERIKSLPHKIIVLNPKDMLFELTPRVETYLQNGDVIDKPDWGFGFMDTIPEESAKEILSHF
ncbi:alpha/beta fold hydrolase [Litorimonas haliclonae]|uniref:alpha/beta fold hydrolase n=1 Tax=Litorimonas haliclonae TaxID=2081977 RepID=UPI0039F088F8